MTTLPETILADLVLAHRFLYYVENAPVIDDCTYDRLERLAVEATPSWHAMYLPGSPGGPVSYPDRIVHLARYLSLSKI